MLRPSVRLQDIRRLLRASVELELSAPAILRLKWFLYAREHANNVSLTCRHFGISRSTFLRWAKRFDPADTSTLEDTSRRPKTVRQPETDERTIAMIRALRLSEPLASKDIIAAKLLSAHGIEISSSTVGRIITRHGFFFADTKAHIEKRAVLLSSETAQESSMDALQESPSIGADAPSVATEGDTLPPFLSLPELNQ